MHQLPPEIIEQILLTLATSEEKEAFRIVNSLDKGYRNGYVRKRLLLSGEHFSIDRASSRGNIALLDWWRTQSGLTAKKFSEICYKALMNAAYGKRAVDVFEWVYKHKIVTKIRGLALAEVLASKNDVVGLRWMKEHGWELNFGKSLATVRLSGYDEVMKFIVRESCAPVTFSFPVSYYLRFQV